MIYEYPLSWPVGVPRTATPTRSRFDTAEERVKRDLEQQLYLMNATDAVVTTNVELRRDGKPYVGQRISDPGVSVYFKRKGQDQVIACDRWNSTRDNLQAIAKNRSTTRDRQMGDWRDGSTPPMRASRQFRQPRAPDGRSGRGTTCWACRSDGLHDRTVSLNRYSYLTLLAGLV